MTSEAISTAVRRLHEKKRFSEIEALFKQLSIQVPSDTITWILPKVPNFSEVLNLMQSSGGALNFNDALIALSCREREIPAIASFDADFDQVDWLCRLTRAEDVKNMTTI